MIYIALSVKNVNEIGDLGSYLTFAFSPVKILEQYLTIHDKSYKTYINQRTKINLHTCNIIFNIFLTLKTQAANIKKYTLCKNFGLFAHSAL